MTITLSTLPQATAQEVFNQVVDHLLTQNQKSYTSHGGCLYRGPDNLKCAAGCLISDEEDNPDWEGRGWGVLVEEGLVPATHCELICALQGIHDSCSVEDWPSFLKALANEKGLSFNPGETP